MVTFFQDSEAAQLGSLDCWRVLGDAFPELLVLVDQEGTILHANPAATECQTGDLTGASIFDLLGEPMRDEVAATLEATFSLGESRTLEIQIGAATLAPKWYSAHTGPIRQEGEIVAALILGRDITRQRELESLVQSTRDQKLVDRQSRDIVHDMNNLLTIILISAGLIAECNTDELVRVETNSIVASVLRGEVLMDRMLKI